MPFSFITSFSPSFCERWWVSFADSGFQTRQQSWSLYQIIKRPSHSRIGCILSILEKKPHRFCQEYFRRSSTCTTSYSSSLNSDQKPQCWRNYRDEISKCIPLKLLIVQCTRAKNHQNPIQIENWWLSSFEQASNAVYISKIKIISTKIIMQFQIIMHLKFDDFMRITYLTSQQNSYGRAINERKILYIRIDSNAVQQHVE